jgi:hypothetical protein
VSVGSELGKSSLEQGIHGRQPVLGCQQRLAFDTPTPAHAQGVWDPQQTSGTVLRWGYADPAPVRGVLAARAFFTAAGQGGKAQGDARSECAAQMAEVEPAAMRCLGIGKERRYDEQAHGGAAERRRTGSSDNRFPVAGALARGLGSG